MIYSTSFWNVLQPYYDPTSTALLIFLANFNIINVGDKKHKWGFQNEQTTQELLDAGYTIEEIKAAFEEVIE